MLAPHLSAIGNYLQFALLAPSNLRMLRKTAKHGADSGPNFPLLSDGWNICWSKHSTICLQSSRRRVRSRAAAVTEARRRRDPIIAPYIHQEGGGPQEYTDMFNHLFQKRIIYIGSRINDEVATKTVASMLALEAVDDQADIKLYINSAGGSPYSVIAIIDTIRAMKPDVSTIALGQSASTATLLLAAGTKGKRFSLPSARIMMHQPSGGAMGSADEVNITTSELNRTMRVVHRFYHEFTGQPIEKIEEETDRDNFMSPQQAIELGIIDAVV